MILDTIAKNIEYLILTALLIIAIILVIATILYIIMRIPYFIELIIKYTMHILALIIAIIVIITILKYSTFENMNDIYKHLMKDEVIKGFVKECIKYAKEIK